MLDFILNRKLAKARKQGKEWLQLARKVDHFRRDVLSAGDLAELRAQQAALAAAIKAPDASPETIGAAVEPLEQRLRQVGGSHYPRGFVTEYVDLIVVGAIVAVGIRTFFLQPFKIPTNSMYPTYNGLTAEVYVEDERPSLPERVLRIAQLGAGNRTISGEPGEELILPIETVAAIQRAGASGRGHFPDQLALELGSRNRVFLAEGQVRNAPGMRFLVLPGPAAFYRFIVGDEEIELKVPADFPMKDVLAQILERAGEGAYLARNEFGYPYVLHTGLRVPEDGGPVLSFDILTGDMLFVDRFTYHFRRPQVGEPFVFNTTDIRTMSAGERGKYYIKRIGGSPGDTLQVVDGNVLKGGDLLRNGEPADASEVFVRNAQQTGDYEGYGTGDGRYSLARPLQLPENAWFALGDNSDESADSREWGYVPEDAIVGRAVFIYYPFSHRWGPSE
ncbi:MAG: signal peptidase I [Opitutales bacterium]